MTTPGRPLPQASRAAPLTDPAWTRWRAIAGPRSPVGARRRHTAVRREIVGLVVGLGIPSDMTVDDHAVFVAMGRAMAARNGYRPEQASSLYVDSGTARDWDYGRQHIFAFTFELGTGTYQPSSAIAPETTRNRSAVLYLIGMANCPYRAIDKQAMYC